MIDIQKNIADMSPNEQHAQADRAEAELTRSYGNHALAFFGLAPEHSHFLALGGEGLVNYRLVNNVAVVLGDPVCAPGAFERVTRSFLDFCTLHGWRVAFYQANSEHLAAYRTLKLRAFKMGEEAILHPQTFTLSGSTMANVRVSARRAERDEPVIQWYEGVPPVEVIQQLELISDAWLEHRTGQHALERGFSMGRLDELTSAAERAEMVASISAPSNGTQRAAPRVVTAVAMTSSGKACAFVTFTPIYSIPTGEATATGDRSEILGTITSPPDRVPSLRRHCVSELSQLANEASPPPLRGQASCNAYGSPEASMQGDGWGWSLDLMRRAPDAPPGVMELLLVRAVERFRLCGAHIVSLGLVAMADTRQEMAPVERQLVNVVTDRLHLLKSRRTLFNFKQKFQPRWESRYVVTCITLALPKILLAVLRLRNYS